MTMVAAMGERALGSDNRRNAMHVRFAAERENIDWQR
jgi:hypothetical protein